MRLVRRHMVHAFADDDSVTAFTIPGKPHAKQRARFSRRSGRAFTPKETVSFESVVRQIGLQNFDTPLEGPVKLTVMATFEPAKSWSKKKTAERLNRPHTQKPDLDNLVKAIKDGLNRVAYADDGQVAVCISQKVWGPSAKTVVIVEEMG